VQRNESVGQPSGAGGSALPQYPIESVDNALKLLLLLGEQQAVRLTEASRYLGVASSTAHRVLAMLQYRGFVRQDPTTKAYGPGPALTGVAFSVIGRMDLNRTARPFLQELNDAFDETAHLGALEGSHVRFLDAVESRRAVRVVSRVGRSLPAHCTSLGKALLATLDDAELARLYPEENLEQVTARSISTRSELEAALQQVRELGYATNREESEEGVASVAAAVPTGPPGLRLGLNVSAPITRMPSSAVGPIARRLVEVAEGLAARLG
jgi:DNA-binding IclR family transcriptional regulator